MSSIESSTGRRASSHFTFPTRTGNIRRLLDQCGRVEFMAVMRSLGGIASISQLERAGFGGPYVRAAWRRGGLVRVRRGWYALPSVNAAVLGAARVGGSLTCISGCAFRGIWLPPDSELHVAVPEGSRHLKDPVMGTAIRGSSPGVVVHWSGPSGSDTPFLPGAISIRECLLEVLHCQPDEFAFAIVESALAGGHIGEADMNWLLDTVPSRRRLLQMARADAGSGTESIFRFRMAQLGIRMRSQVEIEGVGRVDFLIGERLIVELDSDEHHGSRQQRIRDLNRDALAQLFDYIPLRFDYVQVMFDWDVVASTVFAIVERGAHLVAKSVAHPTRRTRQHDTPVG